MPVLTPNLSMFAAPIANQSGVVHLVMSIFIGVPALLLSLVALNHERGSRAGRGLQGCPSGLPSSSPVGVDGADPGRALGAAEVPEPVSTASVEPAELPPLHPVASNANTATDASVSRTVMAGISLGQLLQDPGRFFPPR